MNNYLQLAAALIGSLGFCIMFNIRKKLLPAAAAGGLITWIIYLAAADTAGGIFQPALIASTFGAFYAEICARILKAPSTIFFIPAVVPLVPGGNLYRMMYAIGVSDWESFRLNGSLTLMYALGISVGMCLAWAFCYMERKIRSSAGACKKNL